jgi:hypothetical protein
MSRGKGGPPMGLGSIVFWIVIVLILIRLLKI